MPQLVLGGKMNSYSSCYTVLYSSLFVIDFYSTYGQLLRRIVMYVPICLCMCVGVGGGGGQESQFGSRLDNISNHTL